MKHVLESLTGYYRDNAHLIFKHKFGGIYEVVKNRKSDTIHESVKYADNTTVVKALNIDDVVVLNESGMIVLKNI